ncbi:MAG: MFS transporter [Nitrososphaerales archaeon]|nr:MFS transporter [Nitrososphaerales archaeon]
MEKASTTKRGLAILYIAMLVSRVGFGVIIILFPLYIARSSDLATAGSLALYPIFEATAALPMGRLCDVRGRKLVFTVSLCYMGLLIATVGLTRDIYVVSAIHALMGIGAAGVTVSSLTMITDLTVERNRGTGMGTFDFANIGGYALGLLLGGRFEAVFFANLGYAFFVTGGAVVAAFVVSLIILREPPHLPRGVEMSLNPFKAIDERSKAILPIWFSITLLLGIVFFLPRALARVGVGGGATANLLFVGVVILGVGSIGFGALSDVIGRTRVLLVGVVGLGGLLVSVGLTFPRGLEVVISNLPVIGAFAILTSALVPTILATVGDRARGDMRGSAMGLYSVMLSLGSAVGTVVAGIAHTVRGLPGIFEAATAIFLIACAASFLLWRRASKPL